MLCADVSLADNRTKKEEEPSYDIKLLQYQSQAQMAEGSYRREVVDCRRVEGTLPNE